ncbi:hypothetical protein ETB97_008137 [Aspergillus alliaceus]|uniref:Uncharacterized protein n=1 Tax=Petromyces alliaceus TaxID=209559 RepID=A0A8H5ZVN0_PETAA|nr:hypothetical protein ETB97_008137 [Aspergillus burnettii]
MAAGKQYPFSNPMLEILVLDPDLWYSWESSGHGATQSLAVLTQAYIYSKGLTKQVLQVPVRARAAWIPFYIHSTSVVLGWLRWNLNKFCEYTRVMLFFLHCLRLGYGGGENLLSRSFGYWNDAQILAQEADKEQQLVLLDSWREDMGMGNSLQKYSYTWLLDKIDWVYMFFHI